MPKSKKRNFYKKSAFVKAKTKSERGKAYAYKIIEACITVAEIENDFHPYENFAEVNFSGKVYAFLGVGRWKSSWTKIKNIFQT